MHRGLAASVDPGSVRAERGDPHADARDDVGRAPARLVFGERRLVLVAEQVRRAGDEIADLLAGQNRELLRGVGGERHLAFAALLGEARHRRRIAGAYQYEIGDAGQGADIKTDVFAHRAWIKGCDLVQVRVGRADEPRRVELGRLPHQTGVHAVLLQPEPVVGEVAAHSADQERIKAEAAEAECDVGGYPATAYLEVRHQERQRDLVQLVRDELVGEAAWEGHQVIGGDRASHGYAHRESPFVRAGGLSRSSPARDWTALLL